ncbi:MAG: hypothetical protein QOH75_2996 [Actinomycetota bacterium]|nr:hypothetical protein [Actinomycetota bacterium]
MMNRFALSSLHSFSGRRQRPLAVARPLAQGRVVLVALLVAAVALGTATPPSQADAVTGDETGVGPVDPTTGYPFWVQDAVGQRLDLCLDGTTRCLATPADLAAAGGEAFWFNATANVDGGVFVFATEAAQDPDTGAPVMFTRIRLKQDVPSAGTYRVTHPYGVADIDVTDGQINDTVNVGCTVAPCDFGQPGMLGSVPPFLRSTSGAPEGYLGDAITPHRVTGSPLGTNFVRVERIADAQGAPLEQPEKIVETHDFTVQGKLATPHIVATPGSGSYQEAPSVALVSSEPDTAIRYTVNGDSPVVDGLVPETVASFTDPIAVGDGTTLSAVVADTSSSPKSRVFTWSYVVDNLAPDAPTVDKPEGTYTSALAVTLATTDAKDTSPRIFYTLDGSTPTQDSTAYSTPVVINGNVAGDAVVLKAIAVDAAGNKSEIATAAYTVKAPTASAEPAGGSFVAAQHITLTPSEDNAQVYYTTDGTNPEVHFVTDAESGTTTASLVNGTLYTAPILLEDSTVLKFIAVNAAGKSGVFTEKYLIDIVERRPKGKLVNHGPVDPGTGWPTWYQDRTTTGENGVETTRLELCIDDPVLCPVVGALPDPAAPASLPDNWPDEAFWWSGEASITRPIGGTALLVLAQEAAFGGLGSPQVGQQVGFARLRVRADSMRPDTQYTVTHPYGVEVITSDDRGRLRMTEDIGCLVAPCTWEESYDGRVGPFLRWDPAAAPAAPVGHVGDPTVEHTVIGSPTGTNYFQIDGPDVGGPGVDSIRTDLFAVQGRIAKLRATASVPSGAYETTKAVRLQASFPDEADVYYTTDGSAPTINDDHSPGGGTTRLAGDGSTPVTVGTTTTLKFVAVDNLNPSKRSEVYENSYTIDQDLPAVTASPAPGEHQGGQWVTLSSAHGTRIYYTVNGSTPAYAADGAPREGTFRYTDRFRVQRSTGVRAVAVLGSAADGTEVGGPLAQLDYVIQNLKAVGPVDPANGFPAWFQDFGNGAQTSVRLGLCVDIATCPAAGALPDPSKPLSFPDNFPDEAFWWSGDASLPDDGTGRRARLTMAAEAAFAAGAARRGDQVAFNRIRIRVDQLVPNARYRVTYPYGVETLTAEADGTIFYTDDMGCLSANCDWSRTLKGQIGPFLQWDPDVAPAAPDGFVGDGATPHKVVGSPLDQNLFKVEQVTNGSGVPLVGGAQSIGETDEFVILGKIVGLGLTASPRTGLFKDPFSVTLKASEPGATIRYTTDGSTPTDTHGEIYAGPVRFADNGSWTLKALATKDGVESDVLTGSYTLDLMAPSLTASPGGDGVTTLPGPYDVTLTSDDATARIYYTVDGSAPSANGTAYTAPIQVIGPVTVNAVAIDAAGNSTTVSYSYDVTPPAVPEVAAAAPDAGQPTAVASTVTLARVAQAPAAGGAVTLSGTLTPARAGAPITVTVTFKKGKGKPVGVRKVRTTTNKKGKFAVKVKLPARATGIRVTARFAGDKNSRATTSKVTPVKMVKAKKQKRPSKKR